MKKMVVKLFWLLMFGMLISCSAESLLDGNVDAAPADEVAEVVEAPEAVDAGASAYDAQVAVTLQNPGFETSWTGATNNPAGWVRSANTTAFTNLRNTTTKYAGTASLAMSRGTSTSYYIYQDITSAAGKVYTFQARVLDNANGKVRLYVQFYNGTTLLTGDKYSAYTVNSTSWQLLSVTFTNPASTTKVRLQMRSYDDPTSYRGVQYLDDFALFEIVPDGAPTVSIASPVNNNKVGGTLTVTANVTGTCTSVQFYKGTTLIATDTTSPYSAVYSFNADAPNANYVVKAVAFNGTASNVASITVNKPNHDYRGAGANIGDNGTFFKVWAPHATKVALAGDFNSWSDTNHLLWNASGWWYGFQPGAVQGSKYKFVITGPNGTVWKQDPYGRYMENSIGASIVWNPASYTWTNNSYVTPSFDNMIIYELHVRSFVGKNDGQTYPGTFRKVVTKLDYLKTLGVNMIELMPVGEFAGDQSWGYNTIGYFAIESAYGNPNDLKFLVDEAHKRGIGVIMDVVYNHVGTSDNFMWNYDTDTEYNDGGIYFNNNNTSWGPAPDFGRNEVKQYFQDNAMYWLAEYRMDGLRWDATSVMMNSGANGWNFMRDINWAVRSAYPSKILIAEQLPYDNAMMSGANFHSCWYVDFHHKLEAALKSGGYCNLEDVKTAVNGGSPSYATWRTIYAISHDEAANGHQYLISEFGGRGDWDARAKARVAGALLLFSPGIPMLWEGEEFLQDSYFHDDYDHAVNWTYQNDADGSKMLAMYKAAISTRWLNAAMRSGTCDYTHQDNNNKVLAFKRYSGGNVVLVVVNMSGVTFANYSYGVSTGGQTGQWQQIFCSQDAAYGGWDGAGNAYYEPWTQGDGKIYLNVPKYSVVVMKLK